MRGYSFLEMILVISLVCVTAIGVMVNLPYVRLGFDAELAAAQTLATLERVHRAALSGSSDVSARSFRISNALNSIPGVVLTSEAPNFSNDCGLSCKAAGLCVSSRPFCYRPAHSFTFEQYSGRLHNNHAVFILSKQRKFAVLTTPEGYSQVAELINGAWTLRDDIRTSAKSR